MVLYMNIKEYNEQEYKQETLTSGEKAHKSKKGFWNSNMFVGSQPDKYHLVMLERAKNILQTVCC